ETSANTRLQAVRLQDLQLQDDGYNYTTRITAIATQAPYLAVGFVDGSVTVEHLAYNNQLPGAELTAPVRRQTFAYGDYMTLQTESSFWSAADVALNGTISYALTQAQAYDRSEERRVGNASKCRGRTGA